MMIDRGLAAQARKVVAAVTAELNDEICQITEGAITAATKLPTLKKWLVEQGCTPESVKSLDADKIEDLLETDLPSGAVRRALEIRAKASAASPKKLNKLLAWSSIDDRARGALNYCGASRTGRWSGAGYQPQNMKRPTLLKDTASIAAAIVAVGTGDHHKVKQLYADPLEAIGDLTRSIIRAAQGCVLMGADYSSVEARVLAALALEEWKLNEFRNYDADPETDPKKHYPEIYKITAGKIYKKAVEEVSDDERRIGKTCELAFGYGGGVGSFRNFHGRNSEKIYSDEQVEAFKKAWRTANKQIQQFLVGLV